MLGPPFTEYVVAEVNTMFVVVNRFAFAGSRTSPVVMRPEPVFVVAAAARIGAAAATRDGSVIATDRPEMASRVGWMTYWSPVAEPALTTIERPSATMGFATVPVPVNETAAPVSWRRSVKPLP